MRLPLAILRVAALLAPAEQRREWLHEWQSELWYVDRSRALFCIGAFWDAFWLRRNSASEAGRLSLVLQSPLRCILFLAALAGSSVFLATQLPLARANLLPAHYRDSRRLAMVTVRGRTDGAFPSVRWEEYESLLQRNRVFSGLAYYRPVRARVGGAVLPIARASGNLFDVLAISIAPARGGEDRLVLSERAWRKYFGGNRAIVGRAIAVDGRAVPVAGVMPSDSWALYGRADAWLLAGNPVSASAQGFVIGRLREGARLPAAMWMFRCAPLSPEWSILAYLATIAVALLILPATIPLGLGEYPSGSRRARGWLFLALKLALLLPIVYCGSLDVASFLAAGLAAHGFVIGNVVALRWAILDQRRRCPECLCLLSNPTRIGGASNVFLDWYGTELICAHGHGLLYVPEIATSCYGTQRWQCLDASWSSLFT